MSRKLLSIAFQTDKRAQEYIALAKLVSQYPFDLVSVYCDAPFHPSFGPLMLMAPYLSNARIGPAAVSPFRIHPIDIAAQTALLADHASGGVYLGLSRGAWLKDHGINEPDHPIRGMREAIGIIRNLLRGESAGLKGDIFQVSDHVRAPYPLPEMDTPLMIGTWGKQLARLAGQLADEVKIGGSANPKMAQYLQPFITQGEIKAGRAGGSVGIVMGAVTVVDADRKLARQLAREQVAMYLPVVAPLDPTLQIDPELIAGIEQAVNQGKLDLAASLISDELLDLFSLSGNVSDIVTQVMALFDQGVRRVEFGTPHGLSAETGIQLLGKEVLPVIQKSL